MWHSKFSSTLNSLIGVKVRVSFSANSVNVIPKDHTKHPHSLWIVPSWRISRNLDFVMSSIDCPYHENFDTEELYSKAFHEWCAQIGDQDKEIESVKVNYPIPDIEIRTKDGFNIYGLIMELEEYLWYLYNESSQVYYEASGKGVNLRD